MTTPADISDDAIRSLLHRKKDEPLPEEWLAWLKQEVLAAPWEAVHQYDDHAGAVFSLRMCRAIVEYQKSVSPEWQFNEWVSEDHLSEAVTCAFGLAHLSVDDSNLDFRKLIWMQNVQRLHWLQSEERDEWHSGMRSGSGMRTYFKPSSRGLQVLAQADNQAQPATPATAPEASATAMETAPPEQPAPAVSAVSSTLGVPPSSFSASLRPGKLREIIEALERGEKLTSSDVSKRGRKLTNLKADARAMKDQDLSKKLLNMLNNIPSK